MTGVRILAVLLALTSAGCVASRTPAQTGPAGGAVDGATRPARTAVASTTHSGTRAPAGPQRRVPRIPPVSPRARAAGLRDVRSIVPDAVVNLRYATPHNFVGVRLYPRDARCLVHRSMAAGLVTAARRLRSSGNVLVFWDCYRPHAVQVRMFRVVSNPEWVARPGPYARSHEAGRSVDVTVARGHTGGGCPSGQRARAHCLLIMGTRFDSFAARAHAFATRGVSARAQRNRSLLRAAMSAGGLSVYTGEWWHYDGPGAAVHRPILRVPVD